MATDTSKAQTNSQTVDNKDTLYYEKLYMPPLIMAIKLVAPILIALVGLLVKMPAVIAVGAIFFAYDLLTVWLASRAMVRVDGAGLSTSTKNYSLDNITSARILDKSELRHLAPASGLGSAVRTRKTAKSVGTRYFSQGICIGLKDGVFEQLVFGTRNPTELLKALKTQLNNSGIHVTDKDNKSFVVG